MATWRFRLLLIVLTVIGSTSTVSAAMNWKHLGGNPFYRPSLTSEADLGTLVNSRAADLKAGFVKAGYPDLYPAFERQFPSVKIDTIKVAPGETFTWMLFKNKRNGRLVVARDVTWDGAAAFDAYRFSIDKDGERYDFVVPFICGNLTLRAIAPIPPPPVTVVPPAPRPAAPAPAPAAPQPVVVAAPPAPPAIVAVSAQAPVVVPPPAPRPAPVAPAPVPVPPPAPKLAAAVPLPAPAAHGGPILDVGFARQIDPANYAFIRVGYEVPLVERLYLMGLVGGFARWMGNDGGHAFVADALLDYHWLGGFSLGGGAGFWAGNDGQIDLIADVGYLLSITSEGGSSSVFLEARLPADELGNFYEFGRIGVGLRFRF